jgi:cytochrome c oxidase subunit 2
MFAQVPIVPEAASTHASDMDALFNFMVCVCGFFACLIAILILYFALRYRRQSDADRPEQIHGSLWLEIAWSIIPFALMIIFFVWGAQLYFGWARPPEDATEIYVVGRQWMWKMQHLDGQSEINELHVPVGRPVKLTMTSQDVIHSFFVPAFRVHMDVVPGRYTTVWFNATKAGSYHILCSQYCGTNHALMIGEVIALDPDEYQAWLNKGVEGGLAWEGSKLFRKFQCVTCHSADSKARAPVLENLYGRNVTLDDGRIVRADETYLRESILFPDAKIVAGFKPIMPSFKGQIDEEEVLQLIAFLKTLGPGQTPSRTEQAEPPLNPVLQKAKGK